MSTRSSIYFRERDEHSPEIHIYHELNDDPPYDVHMEIQLDGATVNIVLPLDLVAGVEAQPATTERLADLQRRLQKIRDQLKTGNHEE